MMTSSSAGLGDDVVNTHVSDYEAKQIRQHLMFDEFQDSVWGLVPPSGVSIDQARAHLRSWIPENIKSRPRPEATDLDDITYKYLVDMTPRYKYCLYVDDVCIESLDQDHVDCPVVKILDKDWEPYTPRRIKELEDDEGLGVINDGTTPAPFRDDLTDDWEEDVDWMYMPVVYYLDRHFNLVKDDWDQEYV
ncbi:hypothetical protein E4U14_006851 [Claviceps sp. LM454 group G7]|nr:hypothetical protein E4U14_006851 [Claviceps sp. LM454 group G7]